MEPFLGRLERRLAAAAARDALHVRGDVPGLADVNITAADSKALVQNYLQATRRR